MTDLVPLRRALLSVSDKTGLVDLGKALAARGVELLSTGGTAQALRDAGLDVRDVAEVTGFPEMMDGRVKTLHPMVHGGLLALRDNPAHSAAMEEHGIGPIDLLVVNLYPFEETVAKGADYDTCIENIDIGGPAMIRAAAKNHAFVNVVVDVRDYDALLAELEANGGETTYAFRQNLALTAYSRTAAYDAAVSAWMAGALNEEAPRRRAFAGQLAQTLRYGENPHQKAAFYVDGSNRPGVATAVQHQGKELSYNNINDTDAAFELVAEFDAAESAACAIIKHANPCGVARGATQLEAYKAAFDCDRTSAFGGIVAFNQPLEAETAEEITNIFTEVVIAPGASEEAKSIFAKKKNLRLLLLKDISAKVKPAALDIKKPLGGLLVQQIDTKLFDGELKRLRATLGSRRRLTLEFATDPGPLALSTATLAADEGTTKHYLLENETVSLLDVLGELGRGHGLKDVKLEEPDIEEVIRTFYQNKPKLAAAP